MPGNGVTTEPVAMRIFLVGITVVVLPLVTVTSLCPLIFPWPCTCDT